MKKPVMLVRADAGEKIGVGHVMRCRALAQAWQDDGGEAVFLSQQLPAGLAEQLRGDEISIRHQPHAAGSDDDAALTTQEARALHACWIVADSYAFGPGYLRQLRATQARVLVFDDESVGDFSAADLVLRPWLMDAAPAPDHLDGPAYALLRREFRQFLDAARDIPVRARKILLTFGGADAENWTGRLLDFLSASLSPDCEVIAVVGAANPHAEMIAEKLRTLRVSARMERATSEMARLLAWADLAISASGSTCWEMCALGLPSLVLPLNSNQLPIAVGLAAHGAAGNLGPAASFEPTTFTSAVRALAEDQQARSAMSTAARRLVDGRGAARVATQLKSKLFHLRPAAAGDARLIWEWANDPAVRAASFHSEPIPWEAHERWFAKQLSNESAHLFIVELDGEPVAQIRFAVEGHEAVISIGMSAALRGRRYASALLVRSAREIFRVSEIERIVALIKPGNIASARAFSRAGFQQEDDRTEAGQTALCYTLSRTRSPIHARN
jgi:UDP-2,4-diacetamido-2,4,6-trideoxy-beta-L-altropyranose hydrolase